MFVFVILLSLFRLKPLWMVGKPFCLFVFTNWSLKEVRSEGARVAQIFKLAIQVDITLARNE